MMADDEEEVLCQAALAAAVVTIASSVQIIIKKRKRRQRRFWVRPLFQSRSQYGAFDLLMAELRETDTARYKGFTRLSVQDFDDMLSIVRADITGGFGSRLPIPADMRLAVTLRYLATGSCSVFLSVSVGCQGRISNGGVFRNSTLFTAIENSILHLPQPEKIPGTDISTPYVFVADDAFPLTTNIMKPYAHQGLTQMERIYNYRLSRARRISENVFGIMVARFRVFRSPMEVQPGKAKDIVLAAAVLHNFLMQHSITLYKRLHCCTVTVKNPITKARCAISLSNPLFGRQTTASPCLRATHNHGFYT